MKSGTKKPLTDLATKILEAYKEILLTEGQKPTSVFKFTKSLGISESEFYQHFSSFASIEKGVWKKLMEQTLTSVMAEEVYSSYSVREKLLSFYFTWIETLKANRSYVLMVWGKTRRNEWLPPEVQALKDAFKNYARELVSEGYEKGELYNRPLVSDRYVDALWLQFGHISGFWVKDESTGFENTDALIEKSVNLGADLMATTTLDSALDLAKFLWKNR